MRVAGLADRRLSRTQLARAAARALGAPRSRLPLCELPAALGLAVVADEATPGAVVVDRVLLHRPCDDDALTRCIAYGVAYMVLLDARLPFLLGDVVALARMLAS